MNGHHKKHLKYIIDWQGRVTFQIVVLINKFCLNSKLLIKQSMVEKTID